MGGIQCRTVGDRKTRIVRENGVFVIKLERFGKAAAKPHAKAERTAQEHDLAGDFAALCKTGNGLIDHGLVNACGDVLLACALVEKRLDIGFGEHTAARRDRINALAL